jgi:uncharacterized membrane protein affecting hemolysin expression
VKLPPRSDIVKPEPLVLAVSAVTVLVTMLMMLLVVSLTSREEQRLDDFGSAAARALAELAVQPLMQQDRMHLGVIANRLAELPEIRGVASYSADNQLLTTTGDLRGPHHTQPVTVDDSIVGYVRVALEPEAFTSGHPARSTALLLAALLIPFVVAVGWSMARAARQGRLTLPASMTTRRHTLHEPPSTTDSADSDVTPEDQEPPPDVRHYLLAVNFYNQLSLSASEREFESSLCTELAEAVAEIYQGQVVKLPGVGTLVDFDHVDDDDRAFQVICGAFVLARLLRDEAPFGIYRLGLNVIEQPADETLPLDHEAVADTALLSALAKDMTLAVSQQCFDIVVDSDRLHTRPLHNPLLEQLSTSTPGCRLITDLEPSYTSLVVQQAESLRSQREAISNPSTF